MSCQLDRRTYILLHQTSTAYIAYTYAMFSRVNRLSIRLSNEAIEAGLAAARLHGASSLEEVIEQLLLDHLESPAAPLAARASLSATRPGQVQRPPASPPQDEDPQFAVNPPALTLERPDESPPAPFAEPAAPSVVALPFLTNRLSPLKASARALANLAAMDGRWPSLRDFQAKAGHAAREQGLQLLADDRAAGRRGRHKRSVAWPIGANPVAALERYAFAFTLAHDGAIASGPMATLGLADLLDGRAALTPAGWELALAPSPVLDGGEGTLSQEEVAIMRAQLRQSPPEHAAIIEFVRAVRRAAGAQPRIDELLGAWHGEWSADQAAAQRSAMIGRLEELGMVDVTGRGTKATLELGDVRDFEGEADQRDAA